MNFSRNTFSGLFLFIRTTVNWTWKSMVLLLSYCYAYKSSFVPTSGWSLSERLGNTEFGLYQTIYVRQRKFCNRGIIRPGFERCYRNSLQMVTHIIQIQWNGVNVLIYYFYWWCVRLGTSKNTENILITLMCSIKNEQMSRYCEKLWIDRLFVV